MLKLLKTILAANRARRHRAVSAAIWLLKIIYDLETAEMHRCSNKLDEIHSVHENVYQREYSLIEEGFCVSEHSLGFLECAIVDLQYAY